MFSENARRIVFTISAVALVLLFQKHKEKHQKGSSAGHFKIDMIYKGVYEAIK